MITEKIIEVEKQVEVIVEKIVYQEREADCMTQNRFIDIWNNMFMISGQSNNSCLTEEQFVQIVSKNIVNNA